MAGAQKKVVVRRLKGGLAWGFLPARGFVAGEQVELMGADGRVNLISFSELQWIAYVRDWNQEDAVDPERLGRRRFVGRPRGEGLWVRVELVDETEVEGLTDLDAGAWDGWIEDRGLALTPPEARSNVLRLFVPRHAVRRLEVLGWVTVRSDRRTSRRGAGAEGQSELFPAAAEAGGDE